ncbi:hypothetical protein ACSFA0_26005 [Variovorax sp. LT1P1]|uniref:hypothetical protein n=1 Tax=Variovorax sp. LT1P1 TaxID=3443730 RepID=UPI003F464654
MNAHSTIPQATLMHDANMIPAMNLAQDTAAVDEGGIRTSFQEVAVDLYLVEGTIESYLEDLDDQDPDASIMLRERLADDMPYTRQAHKAALDAISLSLLANTAGDAVFETACSRVSKLADVALNAMRRTLFDYGLTLTAMAAGGARTSRRLKFRAEQFYAATEA